MKFSTLLAITQQSEYDISYVKKWYAKHQNESHEIQPEKWTTKLKLVQLLSQVLFFLPDIQKIEVALSLLQPITTIIQSSIQLVATIKLRWLQSQGLAVIAIAGSYGKTSTKHNLKNILSDHLSVLASDHSINTPIGLAQTILKDLKSSHQIFIAELGEYYQGDIAKLAKFVKPTFGIVTPIGKQHLERMGSIENIANTIGELIEYFKNEKENVIVADSNREFFNHDFPNSYGDHKESNVRLSQMKVEWQGTEFDVQIDHSDKVHVFTPLLGKSQVMNLLPAFWLAKKFGVDAQNIASKCATLPYVDRRHQPMFLENNVNIIDNSFNTNPQSANESLALIKQLPAKRRIVITLGFVELGEEAEKIHVEFGQKLAKYADYIGIIHSSWSTAIVEGFVKAGGKKDHVVEADNQEQAMQMLKQFVVPHTTILFEGGFQEKYV